MSKAVQNPTGIVQWTLILVLIGSAMGSFGQLNSHYKFVEGGEVYTSLGNQSTTLWSGGSVDDQVSAAITIPTFHFNNVPYTQVYVSANGFITFGSAPAGNNYTPISGAAGYSAAISAFGADLQSRQQPGNSGTRDVRYETIGDEFVVEWRHLRRKGLTEWFSFQIRLNSNTREIKVIYGEIGQGPDTQTTMQPQVGLRGASNAFPANVMNRTVGTGSEDWGWSLEGTANASQMRFTSTAPAKSFYNGLTYTWKPAVLYSTTTGNMNDPIWAFTPTGPASGAVVDRDVKVVIQDGHEVSVSGITYVDDLDLQTGGTLALGAEQRLVVEGKQVMLNGSIQGDGELSLESYETTTVIASGTLTIGDLIVNTPSGTSISGNFDITRSLRIEAGVLDATSANVRLRSTATGTARLGTIATGSDYLGELTMERHIPGGVTNWRLLGSAVEGRTVADWNNDFFTAGFPGSNYPNFYVGGQLWPSIRWYNEAVSGADMYDGLVGVTGTTQTLEVGRGYAVWSGDALGGTQAFKVDVKGEPVIAHTPLTLPMTYTNSGNIAEDGWNLVSNPLPSPIAFNQLVRGADVENAYWIYNPTNGNNASWNGVAGVNGANGTIQSSQGFWMKANGPAVTTTVDEYAKVSGNTGGLFGGPAQQNTVLPLLRLKIHSGINSFSDEVVIVFQDGTPAYEAGDVHKFIFNHPSAPQIATRSSDGVDLAINMYGEFNTAISIPVLVNVPINGTYTITANELEGIDGYSCLVLEDLETGVLTPLATDASYSFSILANADATVPRFMIHASEPVQKEVVDITCHGAQNGEVLITGPAGSVFDVIWMNAQGDAFLVQAEMTGTVTLDGMEPGNYMVSVSSDAGCGALVSSFTVAEPYALELGTTVTDASCPGAVDGMLTAEVLGGVAPYSYTWSDGTSEAEITGGEGTYALLVNDANGCEIALEELMIGSGVGPTAIFEVENDMVLMGEEVLFQNTSLQGEAYFWNFGDGSTSDEISPLHIFNLPGSYMVTLTVWNGECDDTHTMEISVELTTGIHSVTADMAHVWSDNENLVIDHQFATGDLDIVVMDGAGRVHIQQRTPATQGRILLPASGLNTGIWLVRIIHGTESSTYRVPLMR